MENEYKKTYKPLVAWMIIVLVLELFVAWLMTTGVSGEIFDKLWIITFVVAIDALFIMIYKGEYVYWINGGPEYEMARDAGSRKRKEYAWSHLREFMIVTLILTVYMICSIVFKWSFLVDMMIAIVAVVIAAYRTMYIEW